MKLNPEWNDRLDQWIFALQKDLYKPLGDIDFSMFRTFEHLEPDVAKAQEFAPCKPGEEWGNEWEYAWFKSEIELPKEAQGEMIVVDLKGLGGESTLFVDGKSFGTYRSDWVQIPYHYIQDNIITEKGEAGKRHSLLCETYAGHFMPFNHIGGCAVGPVAPGDYENPKEGKTRKEYAACTYGIWNEDAYQLFMDVLCLKDIMASLSEGSLRAAKIARGLQNFTLCVDFEQEKEGRIESYKKAREILKPLMEAENGSTTPTFYAIGNAHLDVVWLWPFAETNRKTARTFAAQLRLIEKYPGYKFLQSQPQTYEMCRKHYPELYERIKEAVKKGGWIAEGGMWVEPDTNMASGEALVRQILYGKKFFKDEFDVDSEVLWLPDTFGYSAALPQILSKSGMKYLVTQKIFWSYNGGEQFPYHYFKWQGHDGSEIVSYLPTSYTYTTNPAALNNIWEDRVQKDDMDKFLLPYGYGDGGGGPSRDYIEFNKRQGNIEGCPKVVMESPSKLFEDLEADGGPENTYVGELYFTAHRGVFTSQASVKKGNRESELAVREGEFWASIAKLDGYNFPADEMEQAWKKILLNQFHDILPGSSIGRAYEEAQIVHNEAIDTGLTIAQNAAANFCKNEDGITVFNSLSWERAVLVNLDETYKNGAVDSSGNEIAVAENNGIVQAIVKVPACGHISVKPAQANKAVENAAKAYAENGTYVLENANVKAVFNADGEITSYIIKESDREIAAGNMNRFMLYKDVPRAWDAWDIDSIYVQEYIESGSNTKIVVDAANPLNAELKISKDIGNSKISQTVSLAADAQRVEFETTVDWHEMHKLLKVDFAVDVYSEEAINEIQYGYVTRPTHRSRAYDKDRYEVCNHRYTALCDQIHGAAVLNNCKYGVSMEGNTISLTLLRASCSPEMQADNGEQLFTYAFTAWEGAFINSTVVREGYELNVPVLITSGNTESKSYFGVNRDNVIIDVAKPALDNTNDIIVRMYESKKGDVNSVFNFNLPVKEAYECDMMENILEDGKLNIEENSIKLHFKPFEVKTIRLKF